MKTCILFRIFNFLEFLSRRILLKFDYENPFPYRNINDIMSCENDIKILEKTFRELKKSKIKNTEVTLSKNEKVTISLI